jgi:hypothetical protein
MISMMIAYLSRSLASPTKNKLYIYITWFLHTLHNVQGAFHHTYPNLLVKVTKKYQIPEYIIS